MNAKSQAYVELVVMMLSTMRDIYQVAVRSFFCFEYADVYVESTEDREEYGAFCRRVFGILQKHPELVSHPRMLDLVGWVRSV